MNLKLRILKLKLSVLQQKTAAPKHLDPLRRQIFQNASRTFFDEFFMRLKGKRTVFRQILPGDPLEAQICHFEPANHHFEAKLNHFEAKMKYFEAKMKHFEAKMKHFEAEMQHFEAKMKHFQAERTHFEANMKHFEAQMNHFEAKMKHFEAKRSILKLK